jgi:hypothetical protein
MPSSRSSTLIATPLQRGLFKHELINCAPNFPSSMTEDIIIAFELIVGDPCSILVHFTITKQNKFGGFSVQRGNLVHLLYFFWNVFPVLLYHMRLQQYFFHNPSLEPLISTPTSAFQRAFYGFQQVATHHLFFSFFKSFFLKGRYMFFLTIFLRSHKIIFFAIYLCMSSNFDYVSCLGKTTLYHFQ